MITFLSIVFLLALFISFYIQKYLLHSSKKYNIKKANTGAVRWNAQTKPIMGGIAFYSVFFLMFVFEVFYYGSDVFQKGQTLAILIVITLAFLMGLADDLLSTPPMFKFVIQFLIAIILIYFGLYIQITNSQLLNYSLTIFWVVGIMNSINMIDNMDAVSTVVSLPVIVGITANILLSGASEHLFFLLISIGSIAALLSFLYFNWNPSKMYMGDNGSQFLGALLAVLAIAFVWNYNTNPAHSTTARQIALLGIMFLVPISDTATVTINRLMKGKSPFVGGRDHTTHHLSYMGLSDRKVALLLLSITIFNVLMVLYFNNFVETWKTSHTIFCVVYGLVVFGLLYSTTYLFKPKK